MSNFPLSYKLSWLPRLLKPSLAGRAAGFAPLSGSFLAESPARTVRLAFLGDISAVANREPPKIDGALRAVLAAADLVVGNCESPVVSAPSRPFATWLGTRHAMMPAYLDAVIGRMGIEPARLVLSLANNHALDQGKNGLEETAATLAARGIRVTGIVGDRAVERIAAGPLSVGFLAFTEWRNAAAAEFAGRVRMLGDIGFDGRLGDGFDLVCALPHWDLEFRHVPRPATRALARRLAAAGVGLIAGHHAHVLQPLERIGEALVAYGIGDFLGTALPRAPWPCRIGAILAVDVSVDPETLGRIAAYRLHPFLRIREGRHECLVNLGEASGRAGEKARARLAALSGDAAQGPTTAA